MSEPRFLITGATGATGGAAASQLLAAKRNVRAFVHRDDERSERLRSLGAEVAVGDLLDFDAVRSALRGVNRAYFVYPIRPGLVQATAQFAQAAKEARVEAFVIKHHGDNCCITGYHGATGSAAQTYAVAEFDRTGFFRGPAEGFDVKAISHELAEWALDPFGDNAAAAYGDDGACETLVEVADPLTSTVLPAVTMPNRFSYHVQEIAFFSWFFGSPSIGANGWFSNNGSLLSDAGPVCQ